MGSVMHTYMIRWLLNLLAGCELGLLSLLLGLSNPPGCVYPEMQMGPFGKPALWILP